MSIEVQSGTLEISKFPAGESKVVYKAGMSSKEVILLKWQGNDDLFNLALAVDAIRNSGLVTTIHLSMPYIPYARQDRICNEGESLSIKVVANFINSLKLNKVIVCDSHSDVALALFDNIEHINLVQCATATIPKDVFANSVLVSPDAGAMKKVLALAKTTGAEMVVATKQRDSLTGDITNTSVALDFICTDKDFIIVDDICENGRTFIELTKVLKNHTVGNVYLYVTHGRFGAGLNVFKGLIDGLFVYNNMSKEDLSAYRSVEEIT